MIKIIPPVRFGRSLLLKAVFLLPVSIACVPLIQANPQSNPDDLYAQAVKDYTQNHLTEALAEFKKVTGTHGQEAQEYATKIKAYIDAMGVAKGIVDRSPDERDVSSLDFAIQKYQEAIKIKPDGPWQPAQQLEKAQALKAQVVQQEKARAKSMDADLCTKALAAAKEHSYREAASYSCPLANDDPGYSCGGDEAVHMCDQMTELGKTENAVEPIPPSPPQPAASSVSSGALQKAEDAYNKNDFQHARTQFQNVPREFKTAAEEYLAKMSRYQDSMTLGEKFRRDFKYEDARAAFRNAASIKPDGPGDPQNQLLLLDLTQGVDQFYSGDYAGAEQHLDTYTRANMDKQPLAHFYLGASRLARFFITGGEDLNLRQQAMNDLKTAKQSGFKITGQDVSPKIMQAYQDLTF
jgi:tetratricopeptide (TPR) repeat protein